MMPGPTELIIILIIVVLIFGAKRIPEIMGGLGKGIRTFKKTLENDEPQPTQTAAQSESTEAAKPDPVEPK